MSHEYPSLTQGFLVISFNVFLPKGLFPSVKLHGKFHVFSGDYCADWFSSDRKYTLSFSSQIFIIMVNRLSTLWPDIDISISHSPFATFMQELYVPLLSYFMHSRVHNFVWQYLYFPFRQRCFLEPFVSFTFKPSFESVHFLKYQFSSTSSSQALGKLFFKRCK